MSGVFILVICGIELESRNHLIAGSTMSCWVARCVRRGTQHTNAPQPHVPAWARESATPTRKYPPNGGFFINAQFQYLVFVPQYIRRPTCDGIAGRIFLCTAGRFYQVLICCNFATGRVFAIIRDTIFRILSN